MRKKICINVVSDGKDEKVLEASQRRLPVRLIRFLFGDFTSVYLLKPGEIVDSVDIRPVEEHREEAAG